jgi:hypothetical protein
MGAGQRIGADDLELVNDVLSRHPNVAAQVVVLRAILANASFPIETAAEVAHALGDKVTFRGFELSADEVKRHLSPTTFPIASRDELIESAGQIWAQLHSSEFRSVPVAELLGPNLRSCTPSCDARLRIELAPEPQAAAEPRGHD